MFQHGFEMRKGFLEISIQDDYRRPNGALQTGHDRLFFAKIPRQPQHAKRILGTERLTFLEGGIEAAIIHYDDLETAHQPAGMRIHLGHRFGDIACLIVGGDHKRKIRNRFRRWNNLRLSEAFGTAAHCVFSCPKSSTNKTRWPNCPAGSNRGPRKGASSEAIDSGMATASRRPLSARLSNVAIRSVN